MLTQHHSEHQPGLVGWWNEWQLNIYTAATTKVFQTTFHPSFFFSIIMSQDFSTPTRTMNNVKTAKDFALLNAQDHHPGHCCAAAGANTHNSERAPMTLPRCTPNLGGICGWLKQWLAWLNNWQLHRASFRGGRVELKDPLFGQGWYRSKLLLMMMIRLLLQRQPLLMKAILTTQL